MFFLNVITQGIDPTYVPKKKGNCASSSSPSIPNSELVIDVPHQVH